MLCFRGAGTSTQPDWPLRSTRPAILCDPVTADGFKYSGGLTDKEVSLLIETMTEGDWPEVRLIYEEGLATGVGSFETAAPSWEEWNAARLPHSRLVAREDGLVGWAALSPFSRRSCYAGVAEVGVYVAARARGRGIGRALLFAVIGSAEAHGIWTLQGATIADNVASLALQASCGFRVVGRRERIATRDGKWHDTILTERRSSIVGMDSPDKRMEPAES